MLPNCNSAVLYWGACATWGRRLSTKFVDNFVSNLEKARCEGREFASCSHWQKIDQSDNRHIFHYHTAESEPRICADPDKPLFFDTHVSLCINVGPFGER